VKWKIATIHATQPEYGYIKPKRKPTCVTPLQFLILWLLLMAKKTGCIEKVTPALDAVINAGLFISKRHVQAIREKAGEL